MSFVLIVFVVLEKILQCNILAEQADLKDKQK
jgi:hypothetical protein